MSSSAICALLLLQLCTITGCSRGEPTTPSRDIAPVTGKNIDNGPQPRQPAASVRADDIAKLDSVMDRCFRRDPVAAGNAGISNAVVRFNAWAEQHRQNFETAQAELKQRETAIDQLKSRIEGLDRTLSTPGATAAEVARRNALVAEYNKACDSYNADATALKAAVSKFHDEGGREQTRIETGRQRLEAELAEYKRWRETRQDLAFFGQVNRLYAKLRPKLSDPGATPGVRSSVARLRAMRRELADWAMKQHEKEQGLILVRVKVRGAVDSEDCLMVADTGAQTVTIDPNVVEALGLADRVTGEVQAAVAGGLTTKAHEVVIPEITVSGHRAKDVRAVALAAPDVGIDGLLGQSFLSRYAYRMDRNDPRKLILEPLPEQEVE